MVRSNYYIGWDVGAWHCKSGAKGSADGIVILDESLEIMGIPWRGNLRSTLNSTASSNDWISALFSLCEAVPVNNLKITIGIDTPLGFSDEFTQLVTRLLYSEPIETASTNPYLFRQTERYLFEQGLSPLSAITHMIGSQATKGMHMLAKFAPHRTECGVWTDQDVLTAIEAYPSACKGSETMQQLQTNFPSLGHADKDDALTCALIAYLFSKKRTSLAEPPSDTPEREGWIWVPKDGLTDMEN